MTSNCLNKALAAIDAANGRDPRRVAFEGTERGAEEVYSRRMSRTLERLFPEPSEHLRIAARGQHIERWTHPRSDYPKTREGYLHWRSALMRYHAGRVGQIMAESGYSTSDIARVESLILKRRLKYDTEVQALEDVVCVVFLEGYFADFAGQHDDAKIIDILRKTWAKMSPHGREAALKLDLEVSIYVVPELRRRGVGMWMLAALPSACAGRWPKAPLIAKVSPDNMPSRRLFESAGYTLIEERRSEVVFRFVRKDLHRGTGEVWERYRRHRRLRSLQ